MRAVSEAESKEAWDNFVAAGCWVAGDFTFASGAPANNKIEADRLYNQEAQYQNIVNKLSKLIRSLHPDALWGVPSEGQRWALDLSWLLDIPVVLLNKDSIAPGFKSFCFRSEVDRQIAEEAGSLVGVEDVTNQLTSTNGALLLPPLGKKTRAITAGIERGPDNLTTITGVPVLSLVQREIPAIITPADALWEEYTRLTLLKQHGTKTVI